VVGHLHPGRWRGRHRRQGRRRPGLRLLHDAHRHSQRHPLRRQLRVIGGLTRKYARNLADITVRQAIQLHWLTIESLPEVVDALDAIGLSPKGACGDVVRNVTGCPLAGVAADELIDASPLAARSRNCSREIGVLQPAAQVQNLRHRLPLWCSHPEINDIGLTP
jgi:sulfite reductase (ferredoxin)